MRGCDPAWCGVSVAVNVAFDVVAVANDTLAVMSAANVAVDPTVPGELHVGHRGGSGRPLARPTFSGPLVRPHLAAWSGYSTAHVFGEVTPGFDRVQLDCAQGPTVEAVLVDCADHLPFNYYLAEVLSRVVRVIGTGPDGLTAYRKDGQ